nr:MAG TPA: hypothetical protein [Caudoviricetes sp.]
MVKLLDSTGLARLWAKIKDSFISNRGGIINTEGNDEGLIIQDTDGGYTIFCPRGITTYNKASEIVSVLTWGDLLLNRIHLKNGTSSQVLIADGSIKTINAVNGICGLDANGRIPLAQLGNLDTSLFKLVTSLPSSGESNKIYIVKDGSDANDVYQEYYYTNGAWEKIGTHAVKVDLTPYAKTTDVNTALSGKVDKVSGKGLSTNDFTAGYKSKLDGIANGANKTIVDSSLSNTSTNPVQNKVVNAQFATIATALGTINQSINNLNYTVLTSSEIDAILV